jgi:hypothetical protein
MGVKQIHVWPNHVRVAHLDLVLHRPGDHSLATTLSHLSRLGLDTRPGNVEVHDGVQAS